jgi:RNA polymerase sigma-70 factor (ECF subfamily)
MTRTESDHPNETAPPLRENAGSQRARQDDEAHLIAAAQADSSAFDSLYARYLPGVYRYLYHHTSGSAEVEDLTQQVFLKALEALPRYRAHGVPFSVWLYRIARHTLIDHHREGKRRSRRLAPLEAVAPLHTHTEETAPDAQAIHLEEMARLQRALATLSYGQRELLSLSFAANLSAPEIAAILGIRPATVRKRLSRLLRMLKERYDVA